MPTASAAFMRSSGSGYATTYGTSYNTSSTVSRSSSATRRKSLAGGYTSSSSSSSSTYRPLPSGPGPIDSSGKKLEAYSVRAGDTHITRSRVRPPPITGISSVRTSPLRADHSSGLTSTSRYASPNNDIYLSGTSTLSRQLRTININPLDTVTSSNRLSGRRSASLANLHTDNESSSSLLTANKTSTLYTSDLDSIIRQPSNRRSSQIDDETQKSSRPVRSVGIGEDKKDGSMRAPKYTPSMSRDASPSTSNGSGSRGRQFGDPREESASSVPGTFHNSSGSFSSLSKFRDGGKIGLCNLGNTCFMNSVLQCLSNTRPLLEWCLNDEYQVEINTTTSSMKGSLVKAFATLMKSLWKEGSSGYVSPNAFKTQIQKFAPRFVGYSQQDAQEFLRYLLEGIHEDVNLVTMKPKPVNLDDNRLEGKSDSEKAQEYWKAYIARDRSHIVDIFVGQLKSELKFVECGHRSVTFDPFWDLSLPIPKYQSELTLDDCLRLFMKEEELATEERPMCAKCKVRRSCTKSFSIHRFPQILVIHLKRFSQERYGRKLSALVEFPVKDLNMAEYASEGAQKVTYDLYGVSEHSGGVHSGHYTAICKNPSSGDWFHFNDTRVGAARSNEAVTSEAYVLFYELTSPVSKL
ncbi:ubiquitin carboxyl-terminal hydrolase 2-like [Pomacea canaliculata]|uniref:ubiquitin carboxyl-terminal hydrolase 2-like n=1 Tax=Pomacea canaliculata TaxID=400727 RepID=UPI000D731C71|nr:ubiquitin carboxyl-terminal hydrolase 2-like [Pomacea canaliculata]